MNRRTINALVILGILSLASIMFVQVIWIRKTISIQQTNIVIQEKEDSLNLLQFSENVNMALRTVLKDISIQKGDSSDLYGAVKQMGRNSFAVDINEELHPFYLETLLKREFYAKNVRQDFQYGIYDCFTDSIVFGNIIKYTGDSIYASTKDTIPEQTYANLKWKKDGHYFTVLFPGMEEKKIAAEQDLGAALKGLSIQVEAYPDLKASQNFMQLQSEISDIENKLAAVRRYFNAATKELNIAVQKFPNNIFAGMFGFKTEIWSSTFSVQSKI